MVHLRKWYLDLITPNGGAWIGYAAEVRWLGVRMARALTLHAPADGELTIRSARLRAAWPKLEKSKATWHCPALGVTGQWAGDQTPIRDTLLDSPAVRIDWCCHVPAARASVQGPDGLLLEGTGYVEELSLHIPLRGLPFKKLRWGRFIAPACNVVWIDWGGDLPQSWIFHNGQRISTATVTDRTINLADGQVGLDSGRVILDGAITDHVPGFCRVLGELLPRGLARGHETKWVTPGLWTDMAGGKVPGWAIHEVVRWA